MTIGNNSYSSIDIFLCSQAIIYIFLGNVISYNDIKLEYDLQDSHRKTYSAEMILETNCQ